MPGWLLQIIIIIGLSGALAGGGYFYYKSTQKTISNLQTENTTLQLDVQELLRADLTNRETISQLRADIDKAKEDDRALLLRAQKAEIYQDELLKLLQSHDLTKLTAAKPGLIESRVNEATKKLLEDFERNSANQ
jgi:flagellar basal body-associated protein FliL